MAGILYAQRTLNGKRGRMCVITLDDGTARVEAVMYNDVYDKKRTSLVDNQPLIIRGRVSVDDFSGGLRVIVDEVLSIDEARKHVLMMTLSMNGQADSQRLKTILAPHLAPNQPDSASIMIHYNNGVGVVPISLPSTWRVRVSEPLIQSLSDWLKPGNVTLQYDTSNMMPAAARSWRDGYQSGGQFGGISGEY